MKTKELKPGFIPGLLTGLAIAYGVDIILSFALKVLLIIKEW